MQKSAFRICSKAVYDLLWSKKRPSSVKLSSLQEQANVNNMQGQDLEVGGDDEKNLQQLKICCGGDGIGIELLRLYNLNRPPRFLLNQGRNEGRFKNKLFE